MNELSQSFIIEGDRVEALYNEEVDVRLLGEIIRAEKISDIRFDPERQEWTAVDRKTGRTIARDRSRSECVRKEHAFYEREISEGRIPWEEDPEEVQS